MSRKLPQVTQRTLADIERQAEGPAAAPGPEKAHRQPARGAPRDGLQGESTTETETPADPTREDLRLTQARALVDRYMGWSAIGGAVPVPALDLAAIALLQVQLVRKLAELYGLPFSAERVRSTLLAGSAGLLSAGGGSIVGMLVARVGPWGPLFNMWASSGLAAVATRAVGHAYILHFESGGTALDLAPAKLEAHYRAVLAERGRPSTA